MNPKVACVGIEAYLMIRRGNADGILKERRFSLNT